MKCQSLKRWTIYQKCDKVDGSGNTGVLFLYDKNRLQLSRGCPSPLSQCDQDPPILLEPQWGVFLRVFAQSSPMVPPGLPLNY